VFPVAIWLGKRVIGAWYRRRIGGSEDELKSLRNKQKCKIEELKHMTDYYQTKGLIERFDPEGKVESPLFSIEPKEIILPPSYDFSQQIDSSFPTPVPAPPSTPTWMDRLVDAIIGDERSSKYALICRKCFAHNGLARMEEFESISSLY